MITYTPNKLYLPGTKSERWYAQIVLNTSVYDLELTQRICHATSMTHADVKAVINALLYEMRFAFLNGRPVVMKDLGTFLPSISSSLYEQREDVDDGAVKCLRINYRKSGSMRSATMRGAEGFELRHQRMKAAE